MASAGCRADDPRDGLVQPLRADGRPRVRRRLRRRLAAQPGQVRLHDVGEGVVAADEVGLQGDRRRGCRAGQRAHHRVGRPAVENDHKVVRRAGPTDLGARAGQRAGEPRGERLVPGHPVLPGSRALGHRGYRLDRGDEAVGAAQRHDRLVVAGAQFGGDRGGQALLSRG